MGMGHSKNEKGHFFQIIGKTNYSASLEQEEGKKRVVPNKKVKS